MHTPLPLRFCGSLWAVALSPLLAGCFVSKDRLDAALDQDGDEVLLGEDCDDTDAQVRYPVEWYADGDGDGFGSGEVQTGCPAVRPTTNTADNSDDCDDSNPSAYPGAEERYYDGIDQDCAGADADGNGSIDDFDQDADGFEQDQDCDDTDPSLYPDPSLEELPYDGIDNDCDLTTGDGDKDGDRFWSVDYAAKVTGAPLPVPEGSAGDCYDDADAPEQDVSAHNGFDEPAPQDVHPGAPVDAPYDGIDAACDGDDQEWDADGDGFASAAYPDRSGASGTDCQDCPAACTGEPLWTDAPASAAIFPGADEQFYDGIDQDCRGIDTNGDLLNDDYDMDLDGEAAEGVVTDDGTTGLDCDDTRSDMNSGAPDVWYDGVDTDCGGEDDYDADGDTHRAEASAGSGLPTFQFTTPVVGPNAADADDCDDTDGSVSPSASEVGANGIDDNCDGAGAPEGIHGLNHPADHHSGAAVAEEAMAFGQSLASGDLDGDGTADLVVGAPEQADIAPDGGAALWFDGTELLGTTLTSTEYAGWLEGAEDDANVGHGVAVGDVTGDGLNNLLTGSPRSELVHADGGIAYLLESSPTSDSTASDSALAHFEPEGQGEACGQRVAVGDLDADGYADLAVSCPGWQGDRGHVSVLFGSPTLSGGHTRDDADATLVGEILVAGEALGQSLAIADITGDGQAELIAGGPDYSPGSSTPSVGRVVMVEGASLGGVLDADDADGIVLGDTTRGELGWSLAADSDVDGDGTTDLFVGRASVNLDGTSYGDVLLFTGGEW